MKSLAMAIAIGAKILFLREMVDESPCLSALAGLHQSRLAP